MAVRKAEARWEGKLKEGLGRMKLGSVDEERDFSFGTRFGDNKGTNPEELIGAAHAGCFSMALSAELEKAGFEPKRVSTTAQVHLEQQEGSFAITRIQLTTEGEVPGIDQAKFKEQAEAAGRNCPVSKALAGTKIEVDAKLVG